MEATLLYSSPLAEAVSSSTSAVPTRVTLKPLILYPLYSLFPLPLNHHLSSTDHLAVANENVDIRGCVVFSV